MSTSIYDDFYEAIKSNNVETVRRIIEEDYLRATQAGNVTEDQLIANRNFPGQTETPLIVAIRANNVPMADLLLKSGARVDKKSNELLPLIIACNKGSTEMCSLLRKYHNLAGIQIPRDMPAHIKRNIFQSSHDYPGQLPDGFGGGRKRKTKRRRRKRSRRSRRRRRM